MYNCVVMQHTRVDLPVFHSSLVHVINGYVSYKQVAAVWELYRL